MEAETTTVGIVGLGIMGGAIARNLQDAGRKIVGFDIDAARCREAGDAGIEIAANVEHAAARATVILTSLPNADALHATARAIADSKMPRRIAVELSTLSIEDKAKAARVLADAGHVLLDCPVSGTGAQAKTRDLAIYASGDTDSIAAVRPLLLAFAREVHDVGVFGNGMKMKFVANLLVAIHNVASAEAFTLGIKAGLDPQQILKLVKAGVGNSRIFELRGPMMAAAKYDDATMKMSVWQKDMAIIRRFAGELKCKTPLLDATAPIYDSAMAHGLGNQDTAAVCAVLEEMSGIKRKPS
jgi:L-threonate 2-dehydrogenase